MRSVGEIPIGFKPSGTIETVPSLPMVTVVDGGMFSGPDSVSTGRPLAVVTAPSALTRRSPARV